MFTATTTQSLYVARFAEPEFKQSLALLVQKSFQGGLPERYQIAQVHLLTEENTGYELRLTHDVNATYSVSLPRNCLVHLCGIEISFKDGTTETISMDQIVKTEHDEIDFVFTIAF